MARSDTLAETHDRLVSAIEALTTGEEWRRMLDVARQFHSYSFGNLLLIAAQDPHATRVAGFRRWKQLGHYVRAGEHGIAILAPCVYRGRPVDENDEREHPELVRVLRGFRVVHVFDVAQTVGPPLDDVAPVLLEGDAPEALWERLAAQVTDTGFSLLREDCSPANGTTNLLTHVVVVRGDLSPAQATKTLAHELGHVLLHGSAGDVHCRGVAEVEAESVAYLVCGAAGLVTGEYTFPYVARWAEGNIETVRQTAERVIACARKVLRSADLLDEQAIPAEG